MEIGAAAAIKMVRSVMIKGIEALTLGCFLAAVRAGVVDEVAASMKNNYPGLDWAKVVPYNLERMANHGDRGGFFQTGNTCDYVLRAAGKVDDVARFCPGCLSAVDAARAAEMPTVIRKLTPAEFQLLFRHGFEVADYTLYGHHDDEFRYIGYANSRWSQAD